MNGANLERDYDEADIPPIKPLEDKITLPR